MRNAILSGVLVLALTACTELGGAVDAPPPPMVTLDADLAADDIRARLAFWTADVADCEAVLNLGNVAFRRVPDRSDSEVCRIERAGALVADGGVPSRLSPARPVMTCPLAAAVSLWRRQSVAPAARELLGAEVEVIEHFGVYACRNIYGRENARPSAHATAEAIDIAGFRLTDGRQISVLADWPADSPEGRFLKRVRDDACRLFGVVLSPDYNAAHRDQLHLELGGRRWSLCS